MFDDTESNVLRVCVCVTEFKNVFHGLIFWGFLYLLQIGPNKNTRQIYDNYIIIVVNRQNKGPFFPCPFFSTLTDRPPAVVYSVVQVPDGQQIISLVL